MKHAAGRMLPLLLCLLLLLGLAPTVRAEKTEDTIRVGVIDQPDYAGLCPDGSFYGVNVEYVYKIAQYANFRAQIVLVKNGSEAIRLLADGQLDMMCNALKTAEREQTYLFSAHEVGSLPMCVFIAPDDARYTYDNTSQLKSMTVGAEKDSRVKDVFILWCAQHGFAVSIRSYDDLPAVEAAVTAGEVDAGLYGAPSVEGFRTIQTFSPEPYYFVFPKTQAALKNRVDAAMEAIVSEDPLYFDRLTQKYVNARPYEMEALTAKERAYLKACPDVTVAVLSDDQPYYVEKNGAPSGVLPDFYERLADLTGLRFVYRVYTTQKEAISAVLNGSADVLGVYSNGQIAANEQGLRLTRAYASTDIVLLTRTNRAAVNPAVIAVKNRSDSAIRTGVGAMFPHAEFLGFDSAQDCFGALKSGQADALICGLPSATWLINQNLASAYTFRTLASGGMELCGATAYGETELCSILSKAIAAEAYAFNEIVTNDTLPEDNLRTTISRMPPMRLAAAVLALFALVLVLVWALALLQRRQKERSAVLAREAETRRRESELAALEKATESKNRFFSNISHDMRTPLNAVIGFSALAREKASDPEIAAYLQKIQSSGELLLELINDTLTISRANSGKLSLNPAPADEREIFASVAVPIRAAAAKKGVAFTAELPDGPPRTVLTDRLCLQKILLNLLSNAVKYTPAGGHVVFAARELPQPGGGSLTELTVRDDGIGMSPEFLCHLYEPFTQENRPGYESKGTGLGLSIVHQLVALMGGTIEVQSEPGRGTCFTVRLPLDAAPEQPAPAKDGAEEPARFDGLRALLCEDNELNREIACALLRGMGFSVETAENGREGIDRFAESAPGAYAVVLMDIRMPVLGGREATRRIRALDRPDAKTVPILGISADAFEEDIRLAREAGMDDYLTKPIEPKQLAQALRRLLENAGRKPE